MIRNPPLLEYWKTIILSQFIEETFFAIETFKFKRGLAPALCKEMIPQIRQNRYELRNNADSNLALVKPVHKGLQNLNYLGSKIWEISTVEMKSTKSLLQFLAKIKNWNP